MSEDDESRAFARIVAQLRREDARFAPGSRAPGKRRAQILLLIGIVLCGAAVLLITLGGAKGAVLAIGPWLAGLIAVIRSRAGS